MLSDVESLGMKKGRRSSVRPGYCRVERTVWVEESRVRWDGDDGGESQSRSL